MDYAFIAENMQVEAAVAVAWLCARKHACVVCIGQQTAAFKAGCEASIGTCMYCATAVHRLVRLHRLGLLLDVGYEPCSKVASEPCLQ